MGFLEKFLGIQEHTKNDISIEEINRNIIQSNVEYIQNPRIFRGFYFL